MQKALGPPREMPAHVTNPAKCWAIAKRTGLQCEKDPYLAQNVCRMHGGPAPSAKMKAQERIAQFRAQSFLSTLSYEPLEDPYAELLRVASEAVAAKDYFKTQIDSLRYKSNTGEQLRAEVALWERAMDRCDKVLGNIVRLGIADRLTRVKEEQAVQVIALIQRVIDQLDLSPAQKVVAGQVIPRELRALETPKDPAP